MDDEPGKKKKAEVFSIGNAKPRPDPDLVNKKEKVIRNTLQAVQVLRERMNNRRPSLQTIKNNFTRKKAAAALETIFDAPILSRMADLEAVAPSIRDLHLESELKNDEEYVQSHIKEIEDFLDERDEFMEAISQEGGEKEYETLSTDYLERFESYTERLKQLEKSIESRNPNEIGDRNINKLRDMVKDTEARLFLVRFIPPVVDSQSVTSDYRRKIEELIEDIGTEIEILTHEGKW